MIMEKLRFIEKTAEYEIIADLADDCKPLGENEGRFGLFQEVKEIKKPIFTVGKYEDIKKVWAQTC